MTDPERLEAGLGDLLRRANWQGPAPTDPEPLGAEERARWQSLMDEPAQASQPAARRMPIGLIGATGLVAAMLVVTVGFNSIRNSQQPQPVAESVVPEAPSTPAQPPSRSESLPKPAPKTALEAAPPPAPVKAAPRLPASPSIKLATPGTGTTIASAPEESGAPAVRPSAPAPAPELAPQKAKASRPTQPVPAARNDYGQSSSVSVPDSESRSSADILDEVNVTATRRPNRADDSTSSEGLRSRAYSIRKQVAKGSATGAAPLSEQRVDATGMTAVSINRLELVASGLEATAAASLRAQLVTVTLPTGSSGEVVFEVVVEAGRVQDLRLIEEDSTLKDPTAIDAIRSRLLAWTLPPTTNLKNRIALRVQP